MLRRPLAWGADGIGRVELVACGCQAGMVDDGFAEEAGIPRLYQGARLSNWQAPPDLSARVVAEGYVAEWPPGQPLLLLYSQNKGAGKTRLAVSIQFAVWGLWRQHSEFWPVVDLLDAERRAAVAEDRTLAERLEGHLRALPLLVLDDLGAERETDYARERLFALLDWRYANEAPTVITANVGPGELDPRVASRLSDPRVAQVAVLKGPDRRRA